MKVAREARNSLTAVKLSAPFTAHIDPVLLKRLARLGQTSEVSYPASWGSGLYIEVGHTLVQMVLYLPSLQPICLLSVTKPIRLTSPLF